MDEGSLRRRHRQPIAALALAPAIALLGCAASRPVARGPATKPAVENVEMEPLEIAVVGAGGERHVEAFDAGELFDRAGADLAAQRFEQAAAGYDRVVREFPDSRYVVAALYNAGLALEGRKDWAGAVARYRALVEKHAGAHDALDALFRMGACEAEQGNWAASADAFGQLLAHPDLGAADRVEALARRGLAQYNNHDPSTAERTFREALAVHDQNEKDERLDDGFFVAMSRYYLAEVSHAAFRAAPVRLPERQMRRDLEEKARLLLLAQGRYVDVARARDPGWATAAGYQMATLYREFYDALVGAPIPPELSPEAQKVYLEEVKKEIEPLLRKAIRALELTQQVAERTGVDNEWVRKSSAELEQLRALVGPRGDAPAEPPLAPPTRPELEKMEPPSLPPRDDPGPRSLL